VKTVEIANFTPANQQTFEVSQPKYQFLLTQLAGTNWYYNATVIIFWLSTSCRASILCKSDTRCLQDAFIALGRLAPEEVSLGCRPAVRARSRDWCCTCCKDGLVTATCQAFYCPEAGLGCELGCNLRNCARCIYLNTCVGAVIGLVFGRVHDRSRNEHGRAVARSVNRLVAACTDVFAAFASAHLQPRCCVGLAFVVSD
jgi:hypothetical protein